MGEYLHEYKDNFLKIFAEAVNSKELKGKGCTLKIVGNKNINQKQTEEFVNDLGICNNVEYINHVPQRKLYELIVNAKQQYLFPDTRLYGGLISQKWSIISHYKCLY